MIPDKYASDRQHRTMLNEYRKNLAVVDIAKKYDFVKSVVDMFSIELCFHGKTQEERLDVHEDVGEFLLNPFSICHLQCSSYP